jgi:hypothetical protein
MAAVAITSVAFFVGFTLVYFLYVRQVQENYEVELQRANNELQSNLKFVYTAKEEIKAGDKVSQDKVEYRQVFTGIAEDNYIAEEDIGKLAVVDISKDLPVQKNMVSLSTVGKDIREEEFNVFYLNSNLRENDFVDIRILYPNGEDYVVLSKKALKELSLENSNCFLWLDAEELLRISGAIVDCFLNTGAKLYTVKYVEPLIQEETKVTYNPSTDVINLIKNDPNVIQIAQESLSEEMRQDFDNRLNEFYQNYNGEVTWQKTDASLVPSDNNENSEKAYQIDTNENSQEPETEDAGVEYVE